MICIFCYKMIVYKRKVAIFISQNDGERGTTCRGLCLGSTDFICLTKLLISARIDSPIYLEFYFTGHAVEDINSRMKMNLFGFLECVFCMQLSFHIHLN